MCKANHDIITKVQELMELREEYRNNPDFRTLFRLTRKCNPKALKQMNAIMQALTDTYKD